MSMEKREDSGSPGWGASFFLQTEEFANSVASSALASNVRSPRPSVIYSSKDENSNSQLQKLQRHVARVLKGFSPPPQVKKGAYNPEILTTQKRQWARFQLQTLDQKSVKEPTRLFESMVVVGLHPNADLKALEKVALGRKNDSTKISSTLKGDDQVEADINIDPQVLFVYPPDKPLPLKYKDLLSYCFPGGVEVGAVERSPSLSELNEILLGQEHIKQRDLSFVFRLQVADDSSLYGCCVLVEEIVQKPSGLISILSEEKPLFSSLSRHIITTARCYCILSRFPFFDLHFGILRSIFTEERLQQLRKGIDMLCLEASECYEEKENHRHSNGREIVILSDGEEDSNIECSTPTSEFASPQKAADEVNSINNKRPEGQEANGGLNVNETTQVIVEPENPTAEDVPDYAVQNGRDCLIDDDIQKKQSEKHLPEAVLPFLRYNRYESSESSSSLQGSPSEGRSFRTSTSELELEEPSSSGHGDSNDHDDILEWAKANGHGSLQIICEYYQLRSPDRGSTLTFQPLEHLHSLKFHRPGETLLHIAGSSIDLRSFSTSLEVAEAHSALLAEEEATALSVWTVACICGSLRLENVLAMFAGALLEKQIVFVCSTLGILSASVLSIIPLIRPYQWQSLLMPVLPNDMLDFLDAPVPYIVGVKDRTAEVHSKLCNAILVDVNRNQVKSSLMPHLPQHKELLASLSPYHAKLVGESYLARKRAVFECTDVQIEAAKGFLAVLRSYLDSLCSNLRSHTITNVQSNDDKVSLLLKESFIESFPSRDRPFMKLLVDTQLFSVHTDLVLSFYQKD